MRVVQIPTLLDNYTYLIVCEKTGECGIVDSPDAEATIEAINNVMVRWFDRLTTAQAHHVRVTAILSTHHHWDHVGGNEELANKYRVPVYGGDERIPKLTNQVGEGDTIEVGEIRFLVLEIPGHTKGHIAYYAPPSPTASSVALRASGNSAQFALGPVAQVSLLALPSGEGGILFCGDTLFAAGCGRLFEGTSPQMVASLTKLKNLPDDTKVYCGHEYTQKNLEFALTLEPNNAAVRKKYEEVVEKRKRGKSTVPTTIAEEKSYNPFLRWDSAELIATLQNKISGLKPDPISIFAAARGLKDQF